MILTEADKKSLLKELYELSTDSDVIDEIDEQTSQRISNMLRHFSDNKTSSLTLQQSYTPMKNISRKFKTEMKEIQQHEIENDHINFPHHLFSSDSQHEVLKEISVGLTNNVSKQNLRKNKSLTGSQTRFVKKENLGSMMSVYQKSLTLQSQQNKTLIKKKPSKDKLICYKVQTQTPKFKEVQSDYLQNHNKKRQKSLTPTKPTLNKSHSKSTFRAQQPTKNLTKSKSQTNGNFFTTSSLNSTSKHEKFTASKISSSKCLLFSANKPKSAQKRSLQSTKKQLKSFSSIQVVNNCRRSKNLKGGDEFIARQNSKSKENCAKIVKKTSEKVKTQCSLERFQKKENINEEIELEQKFLERQVFEAQEQEQIDDQLKQNNGYSYLKHIIAQIITQRQEKLGQKVCLERQIAQTKEKILQQRRLLQSTNTKNFKLQNQLESITSSIKSITNERTLLQRCIHDTKRKVAFLRQSTKQNLQILQKLKNEEYKQEQELIEMYQNVIEELRMQIKQQVKKRQEVKGKLDMVSKRKESKESKFNSTLMSSQKIKFDLTDAFKEWI